MPTRYVFAVSETYVFVNGLDVRIMAGSAWNPNDPVVLAHPTLFADEPTLRGAMPGWEPEIEQATAAPGEKRRRGV